MYFVYVFVFVHIEGKNCRQILQMQQRFLVNQEMGRKHDQTPQIQTANKNDRKLMQNIKSSEEYMFKCTINRTW